MFTSSLYDKALFLFSSGYTFLNVRLPDHPLLKPECRALLCFLVNDWYAIVDTLASLGAKPDE